MEQLKQSAFQTGYVEEDVNAAVNTFQAKETTGQTSEAKPVTTTPTSPRKKKLMIAGGAILSFAFLLLGSGYLLSLRNNSLPEKQTARVIAEPNAPTKAMLLVTSTPFPTPTIKQDENNPLSLVVIELAAKIWKVDTKGILVVDDAGSVAKEMVTLNLDGASFYLKKGDVLRADLKEQGSRQSLILTGGNFYFLEHTDESYAQLNSGGKSVTDSPYFTLLHYSFPVIGLIDAQNQGKLIWQKISDTEWQTEWSYPLLSRGTSRVFPIKIRINKTSKLIELFSLKKDSQSPWQDIDITYTVMDTLDPLLIMPKKYKKVDLSAINSTTPTPIQTVTPTVTPTPTKKP